MKCGSWGAAWLVLVLACGDGTSDGMGDGTGGGDGTGDGTPGDGTGDGTPGDGTGDGTPDGAGDGTPDGSGDGSEGPDASTPDGGPTGPTPLPMLVDSFYVPSGRMGDGDGILDEPCATPPEGVTAACHRISWTPAGQGWAGVYWQYPADNWGVLPGLAIAPGATHISFLAWGAVGGEKVNFGAGIMAGDGFELKAEYTLTSEPTVYYVDLRGTAYSTVSGGFFWSAGGAASSFYVADIRWAAGEFGEPDAGTPDAGTPDDDAGTVEPDAGTDPDAGTSDPDGGVDLDAGLVDGGSAPGDAGPDLDGGPASDGGAVEDGGTTPAFPVIVDDHFVSSGYFGDRAVEAACTVARPAGALGVCHHVTWTRAANGWGGIYWQYPENNWGPAPGYAMPAGASKVSFYAWGAAGGEVVKFIVGMRPAEQDGFQVESPDITLTSTATRYEIDLTGVTYTDVIGGFGWVTGSAVPVSFYIDDIRWE